MTDDEKTELQEKIYDTLAVIGAVVIIGSIVVVTIVLLNQ